MDAGEPVPLRWGAYVPGELAAAGRFGLLEPTGPALPPRRSPTRRLSSFRHWPLIATACASAAEGVYDRSLIYRADDCKLVAVVRDSEIVETLPGDAHDIHMSHALSPHRGLTILNAPTTRFDARRRERTNTLPRTADGGISRGCLPRGCRNHTQPLGVLALGKIEANRLNVSRRFLCRPTATRAPSATTASTRFRRSPTTR